MKSITSISLDMEDREFLEKREIKISAFLHERIMEARLRENQANQEKEIDILKAEIRRLESDKGVLVRFLGIKELIPEYRKFKDATDLEAQKKDK